MGGGGGGGHINEHLGLCSRFVGGDADVMIISIMKVNPQAVEAPPWADPYIMSI